MSLVVLRDEMVCDCSRRLFGAGTGDCTFEKIIVKETILKQLRILHLSDLHFGPHHRCQPDDATSPRNGFPLLFDLIDQDLKNPLFEHPMWQPCEESPNPLLIMITGDITEHASFEQFKSANDFLGKFDGATLLGTRLSRSDIFMVPGNHDVSYDKNSAEERLTPYTNFYSKFYYGTRDAIAPHDAKRLTHVHVNREHGFVVVEINSTVYVQKGTPDENRGSVDQQQIAEIDKVLKAIPDADRGRMIKIAIMHHHPVLIPELVEANRGYDAIVNAHQLLKVLRKHGFQLVLHGHKHYPNVFSYDSDSLWQEATAPSMLIAAGGSASSRELPHGRRQNSYSLFSIKWNPEAYQSRVCFVARGLVTDDGGGEMPPHDWHWTTLRNGDRLLYQPHALPTPIRPHNIKAVDPSVEEKRVNVYRETRGNMAVAEVLPSMLPGQRYEVRLWLVPHAYDNGRPKQGWEAPQRVVWSAGNLFPVIECARMDDPYFCCTLNYWGPMLVQAELTFARGEKGYAHVYARMPGLDTKSLFDTPLNESDSAHVAPTPTSNAGRLRPPPGEIDETAGLHIKAQGGTRETPMSDEGALLRLRGWLNKLHEDRYGEAITTEEIDQACGVVGGTAERLIERAVSQAKFLRVDGPVDGAVIFSVAEANERPFSVAEHGSRADRYRNGRRR